MPNLKSHWDQVYTAAEIALPAWAQLRPSPSLEWILEFLPYRKVRILDAGGGSSVLVDHLLAAGYQRLSVLDISPAALAISQRRLGKDKDLVQWIEGDATRFRAELPFSLWHDRGLFHYLADPASRRNYGKALWGSLLPGGLAMISTYAPGGPTECTGRPVLCYDAASLHQEIGAGFRLRFSTQVLHLGPQGERYELTCVILEKN